MKVWLDASSNIGIASQFLTQHSSNSVEQGNHVVDCVEVRGGEAIGCEHGTWYCAGWQCSAHLRSSRRLSGYPRESARSPAMDMTSMAKPNGGSLRHWRRNDSKRITPTHDMIQLRLHGDLFYTVCVLCSRGHCALPFGRKCSTIKKASTLALLCLGIEC